MAVSCTELNVWKWMRFNSHSYNLYWVMFDPWYILPTEEWDKSTFYIINQTSNFDMTWFQQWNEVCVSLACIENTWSSTESFYWHYYFEQLVGWTRTVWVDYYFYDTLEAGEYFKQYVWVWVDPDEFRPWITTYRYRVSLWWYSTTAQITASNRNYDTTVCDAPYIRVEWANLCYVPPCYYSWSSTTGYKHKVQYDTWYSWATWQTPWMIWIPSSSSDHHIYYVTSNWVVMRTKESYKWEWTTWSWGTSAGSNKSWFIWNTPSTSSIPETTWYNYLCYVDWWGYKRRLWVWEVD